jgi:glycerol-3-phosphate dehydrogenase
MDQHLSRKPLEGDRFPVIVVGGGINGVAIARECARAGRRTLLAEQHDFASGTTSRSTRIIHGGLRYLEHRELALVRESLRERGRLLRERPHFVHPLHFLLALDETSRRSALMVRAGLWLYRQMAGARVSAGPIRDEKRKLERLLDSGHRWSILSFEDAQCEFPERLVAEWLVEAIEAGAVARNYTQVLAIDVRYGRVVGALIRDRLSGREERVETSWVINATGPWIDRMCQRSQLKLKQPMVGGVRGSHIVLPRFPGAPEAAVYTEARDGRPIFVIPWNEQILVGTTEVPDSSDPGKSQPAPEEIDYLLRSLLHLFPRANFSAHDIRYSFAGIRPLPFSPNGNPSAISRKHFLHDHADDGAAHMISVIGGKLTTAAQLARECAAMLGILRHSADAVRITPVNSLNLLLDQWVAEIGKAGGISETAARSIVEWHGKRSQHLVRLIASRPELRAPLCQHNSHIVAEAVDAITNECAATLADVLLRRVPVALGPCWSKECSREAAIRTAAAMGWNDMQLGMELEAFENERTAFLRKPGSTEPILAAAD